MLYITINNKSIKSIFMIFDSSLLNWALACVVVLFAIKKYAAGGHCHVEKNV